MREVSVSFNASSTIATVDAQELKSRLARSMAPPPTEEQLALLSELVAVYAESGVLRGTALDPLHSLCPSAEDCWARIPKAERPCGVGRFDAESKKGCMILPWVGPRYRRGGVAVLGMNLRYAGADWEFAMEYRIVGDPKFGQEVSLRAGKRAHGSYWATGTMRDVAAVLRSRRRESKVETRAPGELANALLESARVQAVKCSPIGGRSTPEPAMSTNCPQLFLRKELAMLCPSVLLAYGRSVHGALSHLGELRITERAGSFQRGTLDVEGGRVEVFLLTHPAHGGWHAAHRALVESLTSHAAP